MLEIFQLVMDLLDDLIDLTEILSHTFQLSFLTLLKFFTQLVIVDIHTLVCQTNLIHHDLADLKDTLCSDKSCFLLLIKLEPMVCNLVQLEVFGEVGLRHPLE